MLDNLVKRSNFIKLDQRAGFNNKLITADNFLNKCPFLPALAGSLQTL